MKTALRWSLFFFTPVLAAVRGQKENEMFYKVVFFGIVVTILSLGLCGCECKSTDSGSVSDEQLAKLLVKLELRTRGVIAGHYVKADATHREWLSRNLLLPAAVADKIYHEVVPDTTDGRAWVKMVVDEPRNSNNEGDETAVALLGEIKTGKPHAAKRTEQAYYYAEPIKAKKTCLLCHGEPAGEPDPFFPQYKKNGWKEGDVVGPVIGCVAQQK